jgi:hypothetical protein
MLVSILRLPIRHWNRAHLKLFRQKEGKTMVEVIELVLYVGICLVVLGLCPGLQVQRNQNGGPFLDALVEVLNKNSSEKVMQRVDSAVRRSTCI